MIRRQLVSAVTMTILLTVLLGLAYPLLVTGAAWLAFSDAANGSLVKRDGAVVGSSLVGQSFLAADGSPLPVYFQPRPSASDYDAAASGGSNLGPSNPELFALVEARVAAYRLLNNLKADAAVPVDAVTASASGLDPHISPANARLQASRVASARQIPLDDVEALITGATERPMLGFLGETTVNVVALNLSLDARS